MTAIRVELQLADGSFTSGMLRAGQSLRDFTAQLTRTNPALQQIAANGGNVIRNIQQMDGQAKGFVATLRDLSIVAGVASLGISKIVGVANGWAGEIVRVNAEMERLTYMMRSMSTKKDPFRDAAENVKYLREQATQMPFSLNTIANNFVKLKATGVDPMSGSLKALADGIAAFGGTDEQFNRVTIAIAQMSGKGVIQMEELRQQLGEHMPAAIQLMARSMGITVAELTKEIATGTVAAKPALEKFYAELNRTFGGSAQRMMQTFSGQVAQLKTNMQNLATGEGGTAFFNQIKSQLQEFNDFISSDVAKVIATDIGNAMGSFVASIRTGLGYLWEFRDAISSVAIVASAGMGLMLAGRAISGFTAMLGGAVRTLEFFSSNMREAMSNINLGVSGFRSLGTTAIGAQYAMMGLRQALGATVALVSGLGGIFIALGSAVYFLADHFGYLSNKTKDAYEELKKYGAESRKQAQQTIDDRIRQINEEIAAEKARLLARGAGGLKSENGKIVPDDTIGPLYLLNEELKRVYAEQDDIIRKAIEREDQEQQRALERRLNEEEAKIQASRARDQMARDERYKDEQAAAVANGESINKVREKYQTDLIDRDTQASKERVALYQREIDALTRLGAGVNEDQARNAEKQLTFLRQKINEEHRIIFANNASRFGVENLDSPDNGEKAAERGQKELNRLTRDIAGLQAEINGTNDAVAEMNRRIANGDFGSIKAGGEAVKELHDNLIAATQAKEMLDKISKGDKKATEDLARIREKALEKEMDLKLRLAGGDKMTDAEKYLFRLNSGAYDGLGSSIDQIRSSIEDVIKTMDLQGKSANLVGQVLRQNTFGDLSVQRIKTVQDAMHDLVLEVNGLGSSLNRVDFQGFGSSFGNAIKSGFQAGQGALRQFSGSILDLIAKGESGGDYNATLDNGRWTGGSKNLVAMTLNEVRSLQQQMLANPENRAMYGNGLGSSALGKYQIVGKTLEGLIKELGLTGDELFDAAMQDRMAARLLNQRQGQGLEGLRNEWTSLRNVPDDVILKALRGAGTGPTVERAAGYQSPPLAANAALPSLPVYESISSSQEFNDLLNQRVKRTEELAAAARKVADLEKKNVTDEATLDRKTYLDDLIAKTKNASVDVEDLGKNYKALLEAVSKGKLGKDTDINADEYKKLVAAAQELDKVETQIAEKKKASKASDTELKALEEQRLEINRAIAEQQKRVANPNYKAESTKINELTSQLDQYLANVRRVYGEDSEAFREAQTRKTNLLRDQSNLELTTEQAARASKRRDLQQSLMSETQARQAAMQKDLAALDQWVQRARENGWTEVEITAEVEAEKAAIRQKYADQANPLAKQMREWGDLQGNLSKASAQWMNSLADGLTNLVMGTGDLRSVASGILKDMTNMGIKHMMSVFWNKAGEGGATSKLANAAKGGAKKFGAPVAHTGGILGKTNLSRRMVHPSVFAGAPKFHTGGIIGSDEIPIIAKRGEGVFTPEQMEAMGGFQQAQQFNISAPVTVNGSAGSPAQNDDLAKKMAREMESSMRGLVVDEIRKQARPGNFLNTRSR